MRPNRFSEVYGNLNTIALLKGIAREDKASKFLLLTGPSGHGKSTLAHVTSLYALCEQPTEDKEPCLQCDSCKGILAGTPSNLLSINMGQCKAPSFIEEFRETVNTMLADKNVIILEEFQELQDQMQGALLDVLDKANKNVLIIGTSYKAYEIIKAIRSRAFQLKVGLNSPDIRLFLEQLCGSQINQNAKQYLLSKRLSPRDYEILITNHITAGKTTLADFQAYFDEVPSHEVHEFLTNFMAPFQQFHIYFKDKTEEDVEALLTATLHQLTRSIHSETFRAGNASKGDHNKAITSLVASLTSLDAYRLLHYLNRLTKSKNKMLDAYTVKYEYEMARQDVKVIRQLQEQNKQLYTYIEQKQQTQTKSNTTSTNSELSDKVDTKLNIAGFGSRTFELPQSKGVL